MKQSSLFYAGLLTVALGMILFAAFGLRIESVTYLGLIIFGMYVVFVSKVSTVVIGRKELTFRQLWAGGYFLGSLLFGVFTVMSQIVVITPPSLAARLAGLGLMILITGILLYNGFEILRGRKPTGALDVEPNVDNKLQLV